MNLKLLFAAATLFATLSGTAHADRLTPDYFRIRSISHAGSGCPAGSVAENVSPDLQAFTLLFDSFIAESGPGVPITQKRKNCAINLDFDYPSGWSFALLTLDTRGYVSLERGVSLTQQTSFYFQGDNNTGRVSTNVAGPVDRDYQVRDVVPATAFSPCGAHRSLNVNSSITLTGSRSSYGLATVDTIDGFVTHYYTIVWRRC